MERVRTNGWKGALGLTALAILLVQAAQAGMDNETYPESRFGQPPARVEAGRSASYAARESQDLDEESEGRAQATVSEGATRRPAGLVFGSQAAPHKGFSSTAVIQGGPNPAEAAGISEGPTASEMARKGVQEISLIAGDLGFFPKTIFVSRDVPVRIFVTGASKNTLCIMMDSFQVRRQIRSQKIEEITFTPNVPGKYRFYCPVNGTEGVMVVRELVSASD